MAAATVFRDRIGDGVPKYIQVDLIVPVRQPVAAPPREYQIQVREGVVQGGVEIVELSSRFSDRLSTLGRGVLQNRAEEEGIAIHAFQMTFEALAP